jgi:hypothetical protein
VATLEAAILCEPVVHSGASTVSWSKNSYGKIVLARRDRLGVHSFQHDPSTIIPRFSWYESLANGHHHEEFVDSHVFCPRLHRRLLGHIELPWHVVTTMMMIMMMMMMVVVVVFGSLAVEKTMMKDR